MSPTPAEPPAVEGFTDLRFLGGGGFADVFAATDTSGQRVAIKVARRPGDQGFEHEAATLARVGAPLGPGLSAQGRGPDGRSFLVMELVAGTSLAGWLEDQPEAAPPLADAVAAVAAIAAIVDHVHQRGVVHLDLKPENVLWSQAEGIRLIDFGLARFVDEPPSGQRVGTPAYMAPEQCRGEAAGVPADLYALGAMLFELLVGRTPFVGDRAKVEAAHVAARPPKPSELAKLPRAVDDVIARALAKDPAARFESAAALAAALTSALASSTRELEPTAHSTLWGHRPAAVSPRIETLALLAVRDGDPATIAEVLQTEHACSARIRGATQVLVFIGQSPDAGVAAAIRGARKLGERASGTVVDVAQLRIRTSNARTLVIGTALEAFDDWRAPQRGPLLTPAAAAVTPSTPADVEGYFVPARDNSVAVSDPRAIELRGRDALIAEIVARGAECRDRGRATLTTVVGERGSGKSRVLDRVGAEAAALGFEVTRLAGGDPEKADVDALLHELEWRALGIARSADFAEIFAACERLLGPDGHAAANAIALSLGVITEHDAQSAMALQAPGAWRLAIARVIAKGLGRRATVRPQAIVLDDGQWTDQISLDTVELATMMGVDVPLWICVATRPQLLATRPGFHDRAAAASRHDIPKLDEAASRGILQQLLQPAEHVPDSILAQLTERGDGLPLHLVELAHALHAGGAIRQRPGTTSWYLAADELPQHSSTPLADRIADQLLSRLPPSLAALARTCAVLGEPITPGELDKVDDLLEGDDRSDLDIAVGLARLAEHGVLRAIDRGYAFAVRRDALESVIPEAVRVRIHDAARRLLAQSRERSPQWHRRIARHAAMSGAREEATRAFLHLAKQAATRHLYIEAEQHFTAALRHLADRDVVPRQQALTGRAKVRYRLWRNADALSDLRGALTLAKARGDAAAIVDLQLEEATLLDWSFDFEASARAVEAAIEGARDLYDPIIDARCLFATGRMHWRYERIEPAIEALGDAVARAEQLTEYETRILGLVLLGPALVYANRFEEASRRFEEAMALCQRFGDRIHLGVLYTNRMTLWMKQQDYLRAADDARRALELAAELGNPQIERVARYNLAELLHWLGSAAEAIGHAVRARTLQLAGHEHPGAEDSLLCARIHSALGQVDAARDMLDWIASHHAIESLAPSQQALRSAVALVVRGESTDAAREQVLALGRAHSLLDERLEILYMVASLVGTDARPKLVGEAMTLVEGTSSWGLRFAELSARS